MNIKTGLIGFATLSLAACATAPTTRFASSVKDAQAANRPLVIYKFATVDWLIGRGQYPSFPVYGPLAGLSFINTTQVPINKVVFTISATTRDQKPVTGNLIASGDFTPRGSYRVVSGSPLWSVTSGYSCPRLTGITVFYQDGSSVTATAPEVVQYLTPQINSNCMSNSFNYSLIQPYPSNRPVGIFRSSVSSSSPGRGG